MFSLDVHGAETGQTAARRWTDRTHSHKRASSALTFIARLSAPVQLADFEQSAKATKSVR
jgi:hypothetical protein